MFYYAYHVFVLQKWHPLAIEKSQLLFLKDDREEIVMLQIALDLKLVNRMV